MRSCGCFHTLLVLLIAVSGVNAILALPAVSAMSLVPTASAAQPGEEGTSVSTHNASAEEVERLLGKPSCLEALTDSDRWDRVHCGRPLSGNLVCHQ
jgi:hypothetical protein